MNYTDSVFINCPFDDGYAHLFRALTFAVLDCGFTPRSTLESLDCSEPRIEKIKRLVRDCRYGIHDLSCTEVDEISGLPRFNMPLELGIFVGAATFGAGRHRTKQTLILEREKYQYQKYISDIAGQDIFSHQGNEHLLIKCVRDWLSNHAAQTKLPGGSHIYARYLAFQQDLPLICKHANILPRELTAVDYGKFVTCWTAAQPLTKRYP
jgi:hypothetical protein